MNFSSQTRLCIRRSFVLHLRQDDGTYHWVFWNTAILSRVTGLNLTEWNITQPRRFEIVRMWIVHPVICAKRRELKNVIVVDHQNGTLDFKNFEPDFFSFSSLSFLLADLDSRRCWAVSKYSRR